MRRLAVVTMLAGGTFGAGPAAAQEAQDGDWYYSHDLDDFTDEDRSFLFAGAEDGSDATIGFRCFFTA